MSALTPQHELDPYTVAQAAFVTQRRLMQEELENAKAKLRTYHIATGSCTLICLSGERGYFLMPRPRNTTGRNIFHQSRIERIFV